MRLRLAAVRSILKAKGGGHAGSFLPGFQGFSATQGAAQESTAAYQGAYQLYCLGMTQLLPKLDSKTFSPTYDRLRDAALVLGKLQQVFLPPDPHGWQYGLEVNMRGPTTQSFMIKDREVRGSIDLVRHKMRLDGVNWRLEEYDGPELYKNVRLWLQSQGIESELAEPKFGGVGKEYDPEQAGKYTEALWWLDRQFRIIKAGLKGGLTSPILLYPHHFDLSLVWFPNNDDKQFSLGWSTGDETIAEPYLYITAYAGPEDFTARKLPSEAFWQKDGFSGAILPYEALVKSTEPEELLRRFASLLA
jgi:hypothetical protein